MPNVVGVNLIFRLSCSMPAKALFAQCRIMLNVTMVYQLGYYVVWRAKTLFSQYPTLLHYLFICVASNELTDNYLNFESINLRWKQYINKQIDSDMYKRLYGNITSYTGMTRNLITFLRKKKKFRRILGLQLTFFGAIFKSVNVIQSLNFQRHTMVIQRYRNYGDALCFRNFAYKFLRHFYRNLDYLCDASDFTVSIQCSGTYLAFPKFNNEIYLPIFTFLIFAMPNQMLVALINLILF